MLKTSGERLFRICLLGCLSIWLAGCLAAATPPAYLAKERFSFVQWTNRHYRTERGLIRHRPPLWLSNIGLLTGLQIYRVHGEFVGPDGPVRYQCRTRAKEVPSVGARLPSATYACFSDEYVADFVLAFDDRCANGIFDLEGVRFHLVPWRHDRYGFQEGFFVLDSMGRIRAALSWSFGGEQYNGVYVDPNLDDKQRDYLAIARGALLAMRDGEEVGPICGTMMSTLDRL